MGFPVHHSGSSTLLTIDSPSHSVLLAQPVGGAGGGDGDGGPVDLLPLLPGPAAEECVYVTVHLAGRAALRRARGELPLAPGDLVVSATPVPANLLRTGDCASRVFRVPCFSLGISPAEVRAAGALLAPGGSGLGALASQFLTALAGREGPDTPARIQLARGAADLLALLVADLLDGADPDRTGGSAALLGRIRAYIEQHLTDPGLSPESIARAHFISVRYLHKLFKQDGVTVGQWVRRRRLEACRRELDRPPHRRAPVAVVAGRWGFVNPSHFSRVFRAEFGVPPSQWQSRATDHPAPPVDHPAPPVDHPAPPAAR